MLSNPSGKPLGDPNRLSNANSAFHGALRYDRGALSPIMWQRVRSEHDVSLVSRAVFWDVRCPLRVGGYGQGLIRRHPDDMRSPARAVTFLLPSCEQVNRMQLPPNRIDALGMAVPVSERKK